MTLYTEGFDRFVTSTVTPIATGWSDSCRVGLPPTGRAHVFTAHGFLGYAEAAIAGKFVEAAAIYAGHRIAQLPAAA